MWGLIVCVQILLGVGALYAAERSDSVRYSSEWLQRRSDFRLSAYWVVSVFFVLLSHKLFNVDRGLSDPIWLFEVSHGLKLSLVVMLLSVGLGQPRMPGRLC